MILTPLILAATPALAAPDTPTPDLFVIKARTVETGTGETLEHAVILVENGKIVTIGEDLPIERGIPVVDLPADWVVMPGLVNAYTRLGMDGDGYNDLRPSVKASDELYPAARQYAEALEHGHSRAAPRQHRRARQSHRSAADDHDLLPARHRDPGLTQLERPRQP